MLKHTEIELQLLTDMDMVLFLERGIRGGISQCSNRYSRANNPYVIDYNPTEDTTYLMYYDVNNLYGWAMLQHLPYGGFEWVENFEQDFSWNVADDRKLATFSKLTSTIPSTDSLIYEIKVQCPYALMRNNIDFFDTSDYPSDNQFNMPLKNKKVVGLMKDECNGKIIMKFVGLRSKMYSLRINGKDYLTKAKGVKMNLMIGLPVCTMPRLNIALHTCFGHIFIKSEQSSKRNLLTVLSIITDIYYPTSPTLCHMDIIELRIR